MTRVTDNMVATLQCRISLTSRLIVALEHLSRGVAISVVCAFISLDKLEEIVEFQEGR